MVMRLRKSDVNGFVFTVHNPDTGTWHCRLCPNALFADKPELETHIWEAHGNYGG